MGIEAWILGHEPGLRLGLFLAVLLLMGWWESLAPRRPLRVSRPLRWANNLGLVVINTLVVRLLFPAAAVGVAVVAERHGWGVLNHYPLPHLLAVAIGVVVMDGVIYLQHVMVHAVPLLWRLHRVHHADLDYDVTTGLRFHPVEIILSMLIKCAAILALGPPAVAVLIFEVLLNATAMFNHGNVSLPSRLDRVVRWFLVTPDMHRVHHSVEPHEANSNFGFNLPWWDRLFGTYRAQPEAGHTGMTIGVHGLHEQRQVVWLSGLLLLPFMGRITDYVINRRSWGSDAPDSNE